MRKGFLPVVNGTLPPRKVDQRTAEQKRRDREREQYEAYRDRMASRFQGGCEGYWE